MIKYDPALLEQWDKEYVWHPFTQMQQYTREKPLIIARGEGSYLIDVEGKRYLDGVSSLWVTVHGHCHPALNRAIKEQLDEIAHSTLLGLANIPSILLAKKLVEITPPGLNKVFYSDAGATAVEIALKMAFQYWQQKEGGRFRNKTKFISLVEAYHGDTIGSVSVGGISLFHGIFKPLLFECLHAPAPYCYRCPLERERESCGMACADRLEELLKEHHQEVAAVIIEPLVQGAAGMITAPDGFLRRVRELCTRYNVLLIADEVAVGFGRTGRLFACEHERVSPDLMCLAKGITGGYLPLAATLTTDEVYSAFLGKPEEGKTFYHGHTYTGNPLACAAALASIELFEKENLLAALQPKIELLHRKLEGFWELPHVGDIRQRGMMVGIELVADKKTKQPYPKEEQVGHRVILEARRRGLVIRPLDNVIVLMPVLAMSEEELNQVLEITYESIAVVTGK
ncbi:adenosylmethionine--8-amino-7-oxononanoate transaminase [Desulfofundulus thermocisternus]|uniref:adenosylmethionine--8-amino-7-oxononanoate transaminase n=1 Tax=Desulfofundulus thermocisternus TaxID=42471 RepID=UPI0019DDD893|nr:adenosylmethionine--8-amino-7-oxononanoate transaminase [Thermoanaerobacter sp.]MCS5695981.1 adenosylmethionine--8-amino-7-oxononanoate transaminase [Desulfofundulus thermocisternus]MDK2888293.1 adenosylmethionine---8-amino-7-oxononanoate aminotransferase [Thermoanaerobacter sp.]